MRKEVNSKGVQKEKKKQKKREEKQVKESKIQQIITYLKEAKEELDKVIFPTPQELKQGFISVVSVVTVITLFLALVNFIMGKLVEILL
jgi:preprotein translocase subunit SecE